MKKSIAKKWVAALRSGKYKQTKQQLKNEHGYCCLGVLASISPWKNSYTRMKDEYKWTNRVLAPKIQKWAGMKRPNGRYNYTGDLKYDTLSSKNDDGASFKTIANLIEKYMEEL